jgi:hypothetical protein
MRTDLLLNGNQRRDLSTDDDLRCVGDLNGSSQSPTSSFAEYIGRINPRFWWPAC